MSAIHTTIAGIPIPDSTIAREATEFVQDVATPLLLDHSRRVFPGYARPDFCDYIANSPFTE